MLTCFKRGCWVLLSVVLRFFFGFSILFNSSLLNALSYDDDILNIYSKMMPRFILMSTQKEKIKTDIDICILYDDIDKMTALVLSDAIKRNYPNGLKDYKINTVLSSYLDINSCKDSQLIFIFRTSDKNIKRTLQLSAKNKILTLAYDPKLLESGADMSLFLGRKITPYINYESLKTKEIKLNNILLRIAKIYRVEQ